MLIIDPCLPDQSRSTKCRTNSTWSLHHQITLLVVLSLAGLVTVSGWFKESSDKIRNQMLLIRICISSVQSLSCVWLFATAWTAARQASLSIINSRSLFLSIESVMPVHDWLMYRFESCTKKKTESKELTLWNCGGGDDSWVSLG